MTYEQFIPSPDRRQTCTPVSSPAQKTISPPPSSHQSQRRVYIIYKRMRGRVDGCVCVSVCVGWRVDGWVCVCVRGAGNVESL